MQYIFVYNILQDNVLHTYKVAFISQTRLTYHRGTHINDFRWRLFIGVILYDPPPKFALKTALCLLKPGTRDLKLDLLHVFKYLVLSDPGSGGEN